MRGVDERWNAVDDDATPLDLVEADRGRCVRREEFPHARVDIGVEQPLEEREIGVRLIRKRPDPFVPALEIVAEPLSGLLPEKSKQSIPHWRPASPNGLAVGDATKRALDDTVRLVAPGREARCFGEGDA